MGMEGILCVRPSNQPQDGFCGRLVLIQVQNKEGKSGHPSCGICAGGVAC